MAVPLLRFSLFPKPSLVSPFLKRQQSYCKQSSILSARNNNSSTAALFTKINMTKHATMATTTATSDPQQQQITDIEDFHRVHEEALGRAEGSYIDPETGYTVFTELTHLKRGKCCGNRCRHCPYGFEKVKTWRRRPNSKLPDVAPPPIPGAPVAKLKSGDTETAQKMVRDILEKAGKDYPVLSRNRRRTPILAEESSDKEDDLSSTSSSSYSSSSVSSTDTQEVNDSNHQSKNNNNKQDPKPTSITVTKDSVSGDSPRPTKNVPYTRAGDQGTSQLGTGERRSKTDDAFEAMGTVDELCSFVGVAHSHLNRKYDYGELPVRLLDVMSRLFDVGSHVAKPPKDSGVFVANGIGDGFHAGHVDDLEDWINEMTEDLPELTSFILPTGAPASASLHVCRTVCRRAERRLVPLVVNHQTCDPNALRYLNRLSDFFFVSARWVNYREGQEEIEYKLDICDAREDQRERIARSLAVSGDDED